MAAPPDAIPAEPASETRSVSWIPVAWFGALLVALFFPVLAAMVGEWSTDEDMGHGFFVPLAAGYVVWLRREHLAALTLRPHWIGYLVLLLGVAQMFAGVLGAEYFVARTALLVALAGILIAVGGLPLLREMMFPLFLLAFMIRIPQIVYGEITLPLQLLASWVAEQVLTLVGIPVYREGNVLELASRKLSVVEACSGIRSLLSLAFLSLVYGYFFDHRNWVRVVLFLATVPIAVTTNAARVSITGILSEVKQEFAEGAYHTFEGWMVFLVAMVALLALHQILNRLARRGSPG